MAGWGVRGWFVDRQEAGERLAEWMGRQPEAWGAVVAIPRGGVLVADTVATRLALPLRLAPVRKVGHPEEPEFALGAVALDGQVLWHPELERWVSEAGAAGLRAQAEEAYRQLQEWASRPPIRSLVPHPGERTPRPVAVIDDGLATGLSMLAALRWLGRLGMDVSPVGLVPVASRGGTAWLAGHGARVESLYELGTRSAVGEAYRDFHPVSDAEVEAVLARHAGAEGRGETV